MIAPGSINGVLTGKHYNRCIRSHKLVYESVQQLRLKAFRAALSNGESQKLDAIAARLLESVGKDIPDNCCSNSEFIKWKEADNSFVEKSCTENPTFAIWSTYIDMVCKVSFNYVKNKLGNMSTITKHDKRPMVPPTQVANN